MIEYLQAGRLLMRKAISESLKIPYKFIQLARTDKGKPYLVNEQTVLPHFTFNVSHQGDLTVLAAEPVHSVGIDVMKVEYPSRLSLLALSFEKNKQAKQCKTL